MLDIFDYLVIGFYFVFLVSVGFAFKHLNKGGFEYFAGGCKMNWWLLGASSLVSNFSAWSFTGAASIAYSYGTIFFAISFADILGFAISYLWFGARFRRLRLVTAMDAVRLRFGKANEQFFAWLQILTAYFAGAVWLVGLSVIMSSVLGINQVPIIAVSGIAIVILASVGGKWGVTANDFVQLVLLISCAATVSVLTIHRVGGLSEFISQVPTDHWNPFRSLGSIKYDWFYVVSLLIWGIYQKNSIVFGAAKYIMAKDDRHAAKSALVPLIGYLFLPLFWFIPAVGATMLVPDLMTQYAHFNNPAEASYIAVCLAVLPSGMMGLMVAALFAATMSSMDTALNVNAGFIVKNIYQPLFRPTASEWHLLRAGQVATVFSGTVIVLLAILIVTGGTLSLFDAYLYLNAYIQAPLTVCLFMGVFVRRTPAWSGWSSVIFGILTTIFIYDVVPTEFMRTTLTPLLGDRWYEYLVTNKFTFTNVLTVPLTTLFFFGTRSFATGHQTTALDEFSRRLDTPVDFEKEVGGDNTATQATVIGALCMIYGASVGLGALLIPNPLLGRMALAGCASLMGVVGLGLFLYGRKARVDLPPYPSATPTPSSRKDL